MLCSSLLIRGIDGLLVPMLYAYIAACCAHAALGSDGLKKLAALLKGTIVFLLTAACWPSWVTLPPAEPSRARRMPRR